MLWFIVQLNRAFGLRGRVHIELAGIDQSHWQTQGKRKSSPWRRRGPLGVQEANGTVCHGRGDYLRFLYLSKFYIIINGKKITTRVGVSFGTVTAFCGWSSRTL